jgi:hypothetical protein
MLGGKYIYFWPLLLKIYEIVIFFNNMFWFVHRIDPYHWTHMLFGLFSIIGSSKAVVCSVCGKVHLKDPLQLAAYVAVAGFL